MHYDPFFIAAFASGGRVIRCPLPQAASARCIAAPVGIWVTNGCMQPEVATNATACIPLALWQWIFCMGVLFKEAR